MKITIENIKTGVIKEINSNDLGLYLDTKEWKKADKKEEKKSTFSKSISNKEEE